MACRCQPFESHRVAWKLGRVGERELWKPASETRATPQWTMAYCRSLFASTLRLASATLTATAFAVVCRGVSHKAPLGERESEPLPCPLQASLGECEREPRKADDALLPFESLPPFPVRVCRSQPFESYFARVAWKLARVSVPFEQGRKPSRGHEKVDPTQGKPWRLKFCKARLP